MKASELVADGWYLSSIVSRRLEEVDGSRLEDGLEILNDILGEKSADGHGIPYYSHTTVPTVSGQEVYFIPGLTEIDAITFNLGTVRYAMRRRSRNEFFGESRVDDIQVLPYTYYPERTVGGMNLYIYFLAEGGLPMKITGLFELAELTKDTDVDPLFDRFYRSYLKYEMAYRFCDYESITFPPQKMMTLKRLRKKIEGVVRTDLTPTIYSLFGNDAKYYTYAQANIGRGFYPG